MGVTLEFVDSFISLNQIYEDWRQRMCRDVSEDSTTEDDEGGRKEEQRKVKWVQFTCVCDMVEHVHTSKENKRIETLGTCVHSEAFQWINNCHWNHNTDAVGTGINLTAADAQ